MPPRLSHTSLLHRLLNRAPLLLPLACLISIQLGSRGGMGYYALLLLPLAYLLWQKRWRLLLICTLISGYAAYQLEHTRTVYQYARDSVLTAPELHLEGTLVRRSEYSALLEIDHHAPLKVHLRGRLSGELGDRVRVHGTPL